MYAQHLRTRLAHGSRPATPSGLPVPSHLYRNIYTQRALTLVESMIAMAILAFAVVAVTQAVVAGQMQTADAMHRARAVELGEALMEEILRLPYVDPNGGSEVGRANFDNLLDYHGLSEAAGAISDLPGSLYDAVYQGFSRSVTVVSTNGGSGITVTGFGMATQGLTITVTVQDSAGVTWTLTAFRSEAAAACVDIGGGACSTTADCCAGLECCGSLCKISDDGTGCTQNSDCCNSNCGGGECETGCVGTIGGACTQNSDCCSGLDCCGNTCLIEDDDGLSCTQNSDCCSNACVGNVCDD